MKIKTKSAGVLDNFSDTSVVDGKQLWSVARFFDFLSEKLGNKLSATICSKHQLRKEFCVLLNGRNIKLYPEGLNTELKDGDTLFICVVIAGG